MLPCLVAYRFLMNMLSKSTKMKYVKHEAIRVGDVATMYIC